MVGRAGWYLNNYYSFYSKETILDYSEAIILQYDVSITAVFTNKCLWQFFKARRLLYNHNQTRDTFGNK